MSEKKKKVIKTIRLNDCIAIIAVGAIFFVGIIGAGSHLYVEKRKEYKTCITDLNILEKGLRNSEQKVYDLEREIIIEEKIVEEKNIVIQKIEKKKEELINDLKVEKTGNINVKEHYEEIIRELQSKINTLNDSVKTLNEERQRNIEKIKTLENEIIEELNKRVAYEAGKLKVFASISNITMKGNNLQYSLIFTPKDILVIRKTNNDKLKLRTKLELVRKDGVEIIKPVYKENNQFKQDNFEFNAGNEYPMIFTIPKEIAKNYRKSIYETKTSQRVVFRLTIYCDNIDNSKISQRVFYLSEK